MTKIKVAGAKGALELLADGQQIAVHKYHPLSRHGVPVCWRWHQGRAPWTDGGAVDDLPIIPVGDFVALMEQAERSGLLGAPVARPTTTTTVVSNRHSAAYPATWRLHELFEKHDGRVRPAVRELVEDIGAAGSGRHDTIVAACGRLVFQKWTDAQAIGFLLPIVNEAFGEGCWLGEIQAALDHARRRDAARLQAMRGTTWTR